VAGIGEIEALVAQRKIGDAAFPYGDGQTLPVVKRRVFEFDSREIARHVREQDMGDLAAVPFDERRDAVPFDERRAAVPFDERRNDCICAQILFSVWAPAGYRAAPG
jgi:hypothetical protein